MNKPDTTPSVCFDTSCLFAGIWSDSGGSRQVLRLGGAEVVNPITGEIVLSELESTLCDKAPDSLGDLTILLDRSGFDIVKSPAKETVD